MAESAPSRPAAARAQTVKQLTTRESFKNRGEWITHAHCRSVDPEEFCAGCSAAQAVAIAVTALPFCSAAPMPSITRWSSVSGVHDLSVSAAPRCVAA